MNCLLLRLSQSHSRRKLVGRLSLSFASAILKSHRQKALARPEPPSGIMRPLRFASGIAVFLVSAFCGAASYGAFLYDHRLHLLTPGNFSFLLGLVSIVTVLSFVGAYLLVVGAIKSK